MSKEVNDLKRAIINLEKQNIDLENLISECAGDQTNNDALVAKTKSDLENLETRLKQKEDEAKETSANRNEAYNKLDAKKKNLRRIENDLEKIKVDKHSFKADQHKKDIVNKLRNHFNNKVMGRIIDLCRPKSEK